MAAMVIELPVTKSVTGAHAGERARCQEMPGHGRRGVRTSAEATGVRSCVDVVPAGLRRQAPHQAPAAELHWTPRGLLVLLMLVATLVVASVATIVVQFLAVPDSLPSAAAPAAASVVAVG